MLDPARILATERGSVFRQMGTKEPPFFCPGPDSCQTAVQTHRCHNVAALAWERFRLTDHRGSVVPL